MNPAHFSETRTGDLVAIKVVDKDDFAFVPHALPPKGWTFPSELWPLLAKAKEVLGTLNGIGRTLDDPQLLLSPLGRREAITSSALEGTYATPQELMLFELNPTKPKSEGDKVNEWREVSNYHRALKQGSSDLSSGMPFCLRMFRNLHGTLLSGTMHHYTSPGDFRKHQVAIGSDRRYIPPPILYLQSCLNDLEVYLNQSSEELDPLVKAYIVHYQFEAIHPFYDGNGRVGRVLLALMVYKWCNLYCPWLYMSAYFERFKDEYISKMFQISTVGAWNEWLEFCLRGTVLQATDAIRRCDELRALKKRMQERMAETGSVRTPRILDQLFSNPTVQVTQLAAKLKVSYPTAKEDVDRLEKAGILLSLEMRPATYYSPDIYRIAYDPQEELR